MKNHYDPRANTREIREAIREWPDPSPQQLRDALIDLTHIVEQLQTQVIGLRLRERRRDGKDVVDL